MFSKSLSRAYTITANALRQMLVAGFGMAVPFMVVQTADRTVWGAFVPILLFTLLALQLINWGNKEYLLRAFSNAPQHISQQFSRNLFTRFPLVLAFSGLAVCWFHITIAFWLSFWLLGRFLIQSTETLVIYEKQFRAAIVIETAGFIFFAAGLALLQNGLGVLSVLIVYSLYQLLKGISYAVLFHKYFDWSQRRFDWPFFSDAFPFLLLSLLGFLASKADVYVVARFSDAATTSAYQIANNLLVFVMSVSAFIYAPFTKNIYRSNVGLLEKARRYLLLSGLVIVPFSLAAIKIVLKSYLNFEPGLWFYVMAFAYVLPTFAYGIDIVDLFRRRKERRVVQLLFCGALCNTLLSGWFLSQGYGLTGVLAGSAVAQVLVLSLTKITVRFEK